MANQKLVQIIETAVVEGKFGEDCSFVDLLLSDRQGQDHFASEVVFAEVKLQDATGGRGVNLVIKQQQQDASIRDLMNTDVQFYVETLMYNEILPHIDRSNILEDILPKMFHGCATLGENYQEDILVIQDLRQYGFRLADKKLFLDFHHCALALEKLGKFHALSYIAKAQNPEKFFLMTSKIKEARWKNERKDECNQFLTSSMERGILPLLNEEENGRVLLQLMEKTQDPHEFMQELCKPEEPIAVICHGDFCRNNMIFKYDSYGKPVNVKFFDVATARYASPAIDLSFFLLMNTSAELRRTRWDDLLQIYYAGLCSLASDYHVPSLQTIRSELAKKAAYGYVLGSFFIPIMMDIESGDRTELEDFSSMNSEEIEELSRIRGGELSTQVITDILRDLIKLNCI